MIKEHTIQLVKEACQIEEIIGQTVDLKKKGQNYIGCCPFHNEKTGSFTVSPAKGIYKCFGCGVAGDTTRFIMENSHLSFPDAIKYLAAFYNITVEEEAGSQAMSKEVQDERLRMFEVNEFAAKAWHAHLLSLPPEHPVMAELMNHRGYSMEIITDWRIGYAPDGWAFLKDQFIKIGMLDIAYKLGLVKRKDDKNYDFFRNRIMFPIYNTHGQILAFGGRNVPVIAGFDPQSPEGQPTVNEERSMSNDYTAAKYLNSPDSLIYNKSNTVFGLHLAAKSMRKSNECYLCEGYMDVVSMFQSGIWNTVAACGTAITAAQAKEIKKHCGHVVLMTDSDMAGLNSGLKATDIFLAEGFKVSICPMPEGEDPDSLIRKLALESLLETAANSPTH